MKSLPAILSLLWLTGCATGNSHYQITVGNERPATAIRDVKVQADGRDLPEFKVIAPSKVAAVKPRKGELPDTVTVSWVDPDGHRHRETVDVAEQVPEEFRGQLVLAITEENTVTLTAVDSGGRELSTMPWNIPESWEGSVSVPGFDE